MSHEKSQCLSYLMKDDNMGSREDDNVHAARGIDENVYGACGVSHFGNGIDSTATTDAEDHFFSGSAFFNQYSNMVIPGDTEEYMRSFMVDNSTRHLRNRSDFDVWPSYPSLQQFFPSNSGYFPGQNLSQFFGASSAGLNTGQNSNMLLSSQPVNIVHSMDAVNPNYPFNARQNTVAYESYPVRIAAPRFVPTPEPQPLFGNRQMLYNVYPEDHRVGLFVPVPYSNTDFGNGFSYMNYQRGNNSHMIDGGMETVISSNITSQFLTYDQMLQLHDDASLEALRMMTQDIIDDGNRRFSVSIVTPRLVRDLVHHILEREQAQSDDGSLVCRSESPTGTSTAPPQPIGSDPENDVILGAYEEAEERSSSDGSSNDRVDPWPHMCHSSERYNVKIFIQLPCGHKYAELGCGHKVAEFRCGHRFYCPDECFLNFFKSHVCPEDASQSGSRPTSYHTAGAFGCHLTAILDPCEVYIKVNFPCGHGGYFPCGSLQMNDDVYDSEELMNNDDGGGTDKNSN